MKLTAENRAKVEEMRDRLADAVSCLSDAEIHAQTLGAELYRKSANAKRRSASKLVVMLDATLEAFDARELRTEQRAAADIMDDKFMKALEEVLTEEVGS